MSSPSLRERFEALSKGARVGVVAIVAFVLYLFIDDYCWSLAREWSAKADEIHALLERGQSRAGPLPKALDETIRAYGPVEIPGSESEGSQGLAAAVNDVVKRHRVSNYSYDANAGTRLPGSAMASVAGSGQRIERVEGELNFESSPDEAGAILAELEATPGVDAISALRMDWLDASRKVSVRTTVQAWVLAAGSKRRQP